jgi:hypothetical protein
MFVCGIEESTSCKCLHMWVKNSKYSSLFSMTACKASSLALIYYSYVFCCMSLDEINMVILLACITYEVQLAVKCARVSVAVRMKSLKNWRIASVVILAITPFFI